MAYPFLPVSPCCTDVVLNDTCGCSSVMTNTGCNNNDPCSTHLTASSTIVYDGLALSCTTAEPCDTLNVILQKIDEIICNLLTQINVLTIQVNNITAQIINIEGDIININNQLVDCCNATTTTTSTAAPIPCESFSLTNTGVDPVAVIITDCETQIQEAIVLMPGDTNICVVTDSELTVPGTVIVVPNGPCGTTTTTTTIVPTTTTTTTAYACECLTFYNSDVDIHTISYTDCSGSLSRPINIGSHQTIQVCGCCGFASDEFVTISVGANCVDGECPVPTTTTTTTFEGTTTTTTTIVETCNCVEITISQADLDDATGNTFPTPDNYVLLNNAVKGSACEGGDLPGGWDTAGVYNYCIKSGDIDQLTVSYWKDDVSISVTQSQIVNLETSCFVDGQCTPTTTTTTTCNPTTPHPYNYNAIFGTTLNSNFIASLSGACDSQVCLSVPSCSTTSSYGAYFDNINPQIGDTVYGTSAGCILSQATDGYFIINVDGVYTIIYVVDSIIVDFPNCDATTTTTTSSSTSSTSTTTTTTTITCGIFNLTGLDGGGTWEGRDCSTGETLTGSIAGGDTQDTPCIITTSLTVVNLENKDAPVPCVPSTTTTSSSTTTITTTAYCSDCVAHNDVIGTQTWAGCNLNVSTYANGDPIPEVSDPTAWAALTTGAWCYPNGNPANEAFMGRLYNWYAINDPRGLAPAGYHIPTDTEWSTLTTYLGGESLAGGELKQIGDCSWTVPNTDALDSVGFTALPAGLCDDTGAFLNIGDNGYWWTATAFDSTDSWLRSMSYANGSVVRTSNSKNYGLSVRVIQD